MLGAAAALERLRPARRRLAAWSHWVWPLAIGVLFSAVGFLVLDDYAVIIDKIAQRPIAANAVNLALGRELAPFSQPQDRLYGAAFIILPIMVERIAGLDDTRSFYLTFHLMTHLFFISGGFCCYLLAYRMTGSRLLGLFAMLLFLLHPRMYSHSFWNSKDLPFLSMFMIALFSIHWAFRRGTVGAFLLCGGAVGILVNLRVMGVMLVPAALAMQACDLYFAVGWAERRRVIISGAAFALAAAAIYYASMPYLWDDPLARFGEILASFARHTIRPYQLFQGQYVYSADLPAQYLPVWIGITTPAWALLLAGWGAVGVCWRAVTQAGAALRNTGLRFELLLASCVALPIIAVIALQSVMYNDWRHMYFIWAPLCLLTMLGLRQIGDGLAALMRHTAARRHFGRFRNAVFVRAGLAALAALALASVAAELVRLHPYQHLYFNRLVDRRTPEYLTTQYEMDYFDTGQLEGHKYIRDNHPGETIQLEWYSAGGVSRRHLETFSEAERRRFRYDQATDADYYMITEPAAAAATTLLPPAIYSRKVYNNTIMSVATPDLSRVEPAVADGYREIYRAATRGEPTLRGDFDFYLNDRTLTLVNENCPPGALSRVYYLRVYPADPGGLSEIYRNRGHIRARLYGVRFDGKCLMQATLPDYAIARVAVVGVGEILSEDVLTELRRQYVGIQAAEPALRSEFAVYAGNGALRYVRNECRRADTETPFFLHIVPAEPTSLPADRREYGYGNYDFIWGDLSYTGDGFIFNDKCMATVELPDYEIHGIRTGQYVPGAGPLWSGEFYTAAGIAARASELAAATSGGPPAAQDFFSVYHNPGALTYIREECAPADTAAMFFLHLYPVAVNDLPAVRRQYGFDNRDFDFGRSEGVQYKGRRLVSIPLPDYAIDRIHTGQYRPETGRLWAAEFAVEVVSRGRQ